LLRSKNHEAPQLAVSFIVLINQFYLRDPNIVLSNLFPNTLSPSPSLNVKDLVSDPYKTTDKFTVLHILISTILHRKQADKRLWSEW
jgi:hypothetical protein